MIIMHVISILIALFLTFGMPVATRAILNKSGRTIPDCDYHFLSFCWMFFGCIPFSAIAVGIAKLLIQ